jgi:protein SCO1/2
VISRRQIDIGGDFTLTDHWSARVTPATYRGRFMLIFFGFTHCRQICPSVLARNSRALDLMGSLADDIQPLYITVDPDRDSPEVLRDYLGPRHPRYTGLTGTHDEIEAAKRSFHVFARRAEELDEYTVPHTSFTFLMNPNDEYLAHFSETLTPDELAQKMTHLIGDSEQTG